MTHLVKSGTHTSVRNDIEHDGSLGRSHGRLALNLDIELYQLACNLFSDDALQVLDVDLRDVLNRRSLSGGRGSGIVRLGLANATRFGSRVCVPHLSKRVRKQGANGKLEHRCSQGDISIAYLGFGRFRIVVKVDYLAILVDLEHKKVRVAVAN
jgi:hypothetical protein